MILPFPVAPAQGARHFWENAFCGCSRFRAALSGRAAACLIYPSNIPPLCVVSGLMAAARPLFSVSAFSVKRALRKRGAALSFQFAYAFWVELAILGHKITSKSSICKKPPCLFAEALRFFMQRDMRKPHAKNRFLSLCARYRQEDAFVRELLEKIVAHRPVHIGARKRRQAPDFPPFPA